MLTPKEAEGQGYEVAPIPVGDAYGNDRENMAGFGMVWIKTITTDAEGLKVGGDFVAEGSTLTQAEAAEDMVSEADADMDDREDDGNISMDETEAFNGKDRTSRGEIVDRYKSEQSEPAEKNPQSPLSNIFVHPSGSLHAKLVPSRINLFSTSSELSLSQLLAFLPSTKIAPARKGLGSYNCVDEDKQAVLHLCKIGPLAIFTMASITEQLTQLRTMSARKVFPSSLTHGLRTQMPLKGQEDTKKWAKEPFR